MPSTLSGISCRDGRIQGDGAADSLERELRASADDLGKPGNDDFYGSGRVNSFNAVD